MTSFRTRIRRSSLGLIAILLTIFSVFLYMGLSALLYRHVDAGLLALAQAEATRVELASGQVSPVTSDHDHDHEDEEDEDRAKKARHEHELREAIRFSAVVNPDGDIIWKGEGVVTHQPSAQGILKEVLEGQPIFETIEIPPDSSVRRISLPIRVKEEVRYILQSETPLRLVHDTLRWLLLVLGGVSALMLILAWFGSGWLAREALKPVETLSSTASRISGQTLGTRLSLDAPYSEFQRLAHAFNNMLERLQKVFESQRRFVADAAHELKTPLTAIKGTLEVTLRKARTPDDYREALAGGLGEVDRLITITRSLLTLAQLSGDRPPMSLRPLALERILREVLSDLSVLAEDGAIHVVSDIHPVPQILGDAAQLKQVVINLLDNAIRHTPRGGAVTARLQERGGAVSIMIEDTGSGIGSEHLPHLFDRFYRMDTARDRTTGGTGLGLAIVREIAQAHGGQVEVQSEVGKGSTFAVSLPAIKQSTTSGDCA